MLVNFITRAISFDTQKLRFNFISDTEVSIQDNE